MAGRLQNKTALVTGAAQGIGYEIAKTFVKEGASVIATDINIEKLDEAAAGLSCDTRVLDVADTESIEQCAAQCLEVDVLVNCAGYVHTGNILDCNEDDWEKTINLNVTSMYRTSKAFIPSMLEHGSGTIINIASVVSSAKAAVERFAYGTSKGAVIALTKSIAMDFIDRGIRCNCISPGTVDSPSYRGRIATADDPEAAQQAFLARQPMGRIGRADEIAAIAVLLASDEARYMTGHDIVVDGGFSL